MSDSDIAMMLIQKEFRLLSYYHHRSIPTDNHLILYLATFEATSCVTIPPTLRHKDLSLIRLNINTSYRWIELKSSGPKSQIQCNKPHISTKHAKTAQDQAVQENARHEGGLRSDISSMMCFHKAMSSSPLDSSKNYQAHL